jgi:YHS domain-containing protein
MACLQTPRRPGSRLLPRGIVMLAVIMLGQLPAWAAVQWHPDLATARAASRISQRPVLAIFVASWSANCSALETTTFASAEAEAILAACFEPVRVDIDTHAELTRQLGVTHVPTACVLGTDDAPLAKFELPPAPAEFVASAVRAAQQAAAGERPAATTSDPGLAVAPRGAADSGVGATQLAFEGLGPEAGSPLTEKVRRLSAFAANAASPQAAAPLESFAQARPPSAPPQPVAQQATSQPWPRQPAPPAAPQLPQQPLPATPPAWPQLASTAAPERVPPGPRPSIEPATAAGAAPATPWLDAPLAAQPAPARMATATPQAPPAALPPAATPGDPAPPKTNAFIAALQKPFAWRNPFAAAPKPATEPPPTMPPARSLAATDAARYPDSPAPTANPAQPEDPIGSMPLGLEGYCPVTVFERGVWTEGRAQWGVRHRGRTYLFSGEVQQQAFLADPDRFAPALSGDDPVLALEGGRSTPGQRRYGVTYQSRTYLFASPDTRTKFAADPGRYAARVTIAEQPERIARR